MRGKYFLCLFFLLFCSEIFLFSEKYALVVGIRYDKFPGQEIPECVQDAQAVSKLLQSQYHFSKSNIRLILAENATRENIVEAMESISQKASAQDQVVFYYSGHGAQIDDDSGDEDDDLDESIVTYDKEYIRDDKIGEFVDRIAKKQGNAIVIFDSCYSGASVQKSIESNKIE